MHKLIISIMWLLAAMSSATAVQTNGVFLTDSTIECRYIFQSQQMVTNYLMPGKTYMLKEAVLEFTATNDTVFMFSSGLTMKIDAGSEFDINVFLQSVENIEDVPCKAIFSEHNMTLTFQKGRFVVLYNTTNLIESFVGIITPCMSYQLMKGKFIFEVSDKVTIASILDGALQIQNDKKTMANKGKMSMAVPVPLRDKKMKERVITDVQAIAAEDINNNMLSISNIYNISTNIQFFIIHGRVLGINVK